MLEHIHKIIQEKTHIFCSILSSWFEPKKCKRNACVLTVYPPGHPWNVGGMILVLKCARAYNWERGRKRKSSKFLPFQGIWVLTETSKQTMTDSLNCFRVMNYASNLSNQLHKWISETKIRKKLLFWEVELFVSKAYINFFF